MAPVRCVNAPATAQLFVQLSLRQRCGYHFSSTTTATAPSTSTYVPVFDHFLLPSVKNSVSTRASYTQISTRYPPPSFIAVPSDRSGNSKKHHSSSADSGRKWLAPRPSARGIAPPSRIFLRREFSTTTSRRRTQAVYNPIDDEDGNEMLLEITPRAAKRLSDIMARDSNPRLALRIQVESGGCHGFQYLMSLVTLPDHLVSQPSDEASASSGSESDSSGSSSQTTAGGTDDTIFAYQKDDADGGGVVASNESGEKEKRTLLKTAPKIVLDGPSLDLLKGSKVDFTMELIGSQFKIVDNPLATSSCGCGTSFDIKV